MRTIEFNFYCHQPHHRSRSLSLPLSIMVIVVLSSCRRSCSLSLPLLLSLSIMVYCCILALALSPPLSLSLSIMVYCCILALALSLPPSLALPLFLSLPPSLHLIIAVTIVSIAISSSTLPFNYPRHHRCYRHLILVVAIVEVTLQWLVEGGKQLQYYWGDKIVKNVTQNRSKILAFFLLRVWALLFESPQ